LGELAVESAECAFHLAQVPKFFTERHIAICDNTIANCDGGQEENSAYFEGDARSGEGLLPGLATGDAIGKQTETLARADVRHWYPHGIRGFEGRPGDLIPRYAGKGYGWRIGETTDDDQFEKICAILSCKWEALTRLCHRIPLPKGGVA
jgi:hypothetical protein